MDISAFFFLSKRNNKSEKVYKTQGIKKIKKKERDYHHIESLSFLPKRVTTIALFPIPFASIEQDGVS